MNEVMNGEEHEVVRVGERSAGSDETEGPWSIHWINLNIWGRQSRKRGAIREGK